MSTSEVCASFGTKLVFKGVRCKSRTLLDRSRSLTEMHFGRDRPSRTRDVILPPLRRTTPAAPSRRPCGFWRLQPFSLTVGPCFTLYLPWLLLADLGHLLHSLLQPFSLHVHLSLAPLDLVLVFGRNLVEALCWYLCECWLKLCWVVEVSLGTS